MKLMSNDNITYTIVKYIYIWYFFLSENSGILYKRLKLPKKCFKEDIWYNLFFLNSKDFKDNFIFLKW